MAKVRYHLAPGGPGVCRVDLSNPKSKGCPFGGESGSENHFASMKEAESAYEEKMDSEGSGTISVTRSRRSDDNSSDSSANGEVPTEVAAALKDRSYGVSYSRESGYRAQSSEGIRRMCSTLGGPEINVEMEYEESAPGEVIRSVRIRPGSKGGNFDLRIANGNIQEDLKSHRQLESIASKSSGPYWKNSSLSADLF